MTIRPALLALVLSGAPLTAAHAQAAGDPAKGATVFRQQCAVCHSIVEDTGPRPAPSMKGIFGRKAATVPNFTYSKALKDSGLTWNQANLDKYLVAPTATVPGTFMVMAVPNATQRRDVIAYLESLKP